MKKRLPLTIITGMLFFVMHLHQSVYTKEYAITVDGSKKVSPIRHFWSECVGTGTMIYCLKPEWKTAMEIGVKEAGFKRVIGHGILIGWNGTDNTIIMAKNGSSVSYNWTNVDSIFDYLLSINVRPVVELSFMPKALQTNGATSKPNDLNLWRNLIKALVSHCIKRYGEQEVTSWYWEVWNEYDYYGFWKNSKEDYYALYAKAAEGARAANPNIKIGGPVTTGSFEQLTDFIDYCKVNNVPYDFLSNHCYGSAPGSSTRPTEVRDDNRRRAIAIKSSGKKLYSLNTEYNSTWAGSGGYTQANVLSMDSHINAPFIVKTQKLIIDDFLSGQYPLPDVLSYWAISDVFDESGLRLSSWIENNNYKPFGGVYGLINYQGIRKASFNAYKMLHVLGDTLVSLSGGSGECDGVDGFATTRYDHTDSAEVAVIIYNYHDSLTASGGENSATLTVNNLPKAEYIVNRYLIDENHSNPYGVWVKQGKPVKPSENQWNEMRNAQNLFKVDTKGFDNSVDPKPYSTSFSLNRYAVSLLVFKKSGSVKTDYSRHTRLEKISLIKNGSTIAFKNVPTSGPVFLSVYNATGKLLRRYNQVPKSIVMSQFSSGLHLIELSTPQGTLMDKYTVW